MGRRARVLGGPASQGPTARRPPPRPGKCRPAVVGRAREDELRDSYLTYAMSVIVSRALPDVRDGLKPSQRRILVAMPDRSRPVKGADRGTISVTKVRAWVLATTGWPHATLARLKPADLHLEAPEPYAVLAGRHKGRGTRARAVPLLPDAVRWLRRWLALGAAARGPFSASSLRKSFRIAVQRARARWEAAEARAAAYQQREPRPWPVHEDVKPYDVRHSFAVRVILQTRDVFAAKELLLHEDMKTTLQYLDAAVTPAATAAIARMKIRRRV